jgi:hypothetical protein
MGIQRRRGLGKKREREKDRESEREREAGCLQERKDLQFAFAGTTSKYTLQCI